MRPSSFSFGLLLLATCGDGAIVQLSGRLGSTPSSLQRRASTTVYRANLTYTANATFNGQPISIMIDSGSSDLWVSSPVPGAVPQNYQANVTYDAGSASGNVLSATFDFAGFSVDSQFFIEAPGSDAAAGVTGLFGLAPSSASNIRLLANSSAANPPLDRIFTSNTSVSPYIAVLLQRSDDPQEPYPGNLGIGEVLPIYQDVLNQPRLPVVLTPVQGNQLWLTSLDVDGIIGPNGKPIDIKTQITGAQTRNATVVLDTGYTMPQVPPRVAQALYGDIPGAVLTNVSDLGEIWALPCDAELNATFLFGGVEFPIHPLDLNFNPEEEGESVCVGAFQPRVFGNDTDYDMILGMAFLRNAYTVMNFGDLLDGATPSTTTAYIQLLPITNATEAAQDFAAVRKKHTSPSKSSLLWLTALIIAIVLLVLLVGGTAYCYRLRSKSAPSTVWAADTRYRPVHEPSPQAAYDMHMKPGTQSSSGSTQPAYWTAWEARYA